MASAYSANSLYYTIMILMRWHAALDMPKNNKQWHIDDMADEYAELQEARGLIATWSELSDVAYTDTRGKWSGHSVDLPISKPKYYVGLVYMYPKYTARYIFFKRAGKKAGATIPLKEVRNPKKTHKLHTIAGNYQINPQTFQQICEKQLKYWPLLP